MKRIHRTLACLVASMSCSPDLHAEDWGADFGLQAGLRMEVQSPGPRRLVLVARKGCNPETKVLWYAVCVVPVDLEVFEPDSGQPVQRSSLDNVRLYKILPSHVFGGQFVDWSPAIAGTADLDFDGNPDLLLSIDAPRSFVDRRATALVWDPARKQYRRHEAISALSESAWLEPVPGAHRLVTRARTPSLTGPEEDTEYAWADGKLEPVKRTLRTVRADRSATDVVESAWKGGKWVEVATRQEGPPPLPPAPPEPPPIVR